MVGPANLEKKVVKEETLKKKGFTLVELLVVIAIIALLSGILMPALSRVRQLANRLVCGSNLAGIGKAFLTYANDNEGNYPVAGLKGDVWSTKGYITDWLEATREDAFIYEKAGGASTIASSLYLLIKEGYASPKQFICKGDAGATEFRISDYSPHVDIPDYIRTFEDPWDFGKPVLDELGTGPAFHCSYSYHMPYYSPTRPRTSGFPVTTSSSTKSPLCADKNPYLDKNATDYIVDAGRYVIWDPVNGYTDPAPGAPENKPFGNSASHQRKGQNVLYNDGHVEFATTPNVGIEEDNIWRRWTHGRPLADRERQIGMVSPTGNGNGAPWSVQDAYLVQEGNRPQDLP